MYLFDELLRIPVFKKSMGPFVTSIDDKHSQLVLANLTARITGQNDKHEIAHIRADEGGEGRILLEYNVLGQPVAIVYETKGYRTPAQHLDISVAPVWEGEPLSYSDLETAFQCVIRDPSLLKVYQAAFSHNLELQPEKTESIVDLSEL